jgi:hypothetical protein
MGINDLKSAIKPDGGLRANERIFLEWEVGDNIVVLDGNFTVEQLEFIVAHIKKQEKESESV